jgi:hypothetical protein
MEARRLVPPSTRAPRCAGPGPQCPTPVRTIERLVWGLVYGGLVSLLGWGLFLRWVFLSARP